MFEKNLVEKLLNTVETCRGSQMLLLNFCAKKNL